MKLILQIIVALVIAYMLRYQLRVPEMIWPVTGGYITIGWPYVIIAAFIIVAMANAVNFTDGIDGLAGMISLTAFGIYGIVAMTQGQIYLARFCFCIVGALAGFLWFNVKPAQLFMGDTGSQALGATLAVVALMTGQWLWLPPNRHHSYCGDALGRHSGDLLQSHRRTPGLQENTYSPSL